MATKPLTASDDLAAIVALLKGGHSPGNFLHYGCKVKNSTALGEALP